MDMDWEDSLVDTIQDDFKKFDTEVSNDAVLQLVQRFRKDGKEDKEMRLAAQIFRQIYDEQLCRESGSHKSHITFLTAKNLKEIDETINVFSSSQCHAEENPKKDLQKIMTPFNESSEDKDDNQSRAEGQSSELIEEFYEKFCQENKPIINDWELFVKAKKHLKNGFSTDLRDFFPTMESVVKYYDQFMTICDLIK